MTPTRRRVAILGAGAVVLVLVAAGVAAHLAASHHAPSRFALSTTQPTGSHSGLSGMWVIARGSEVGYRVREQFINQPGPTEAVARTPQVSGAMQVKLGGTSYWATAIDFAADPSTLVSQDQYATFQAYQRDFFVRTIYLQTNLYPKAEFRADNVEVALDQAPGPVTLDVPGRLSVHGVTKSVTTRLQAQINGAALEVAGSISVDMRDFNVSPPDISFTKAEPAVLIEYHLVLARS